MLGIIISTIALTVTFMTLIKGTAKSDLIIDSAIFWNSAWLLLMYVANYYAK